MSDWLNAVGFWIEPWNQRLFQASWHGAVVLAVAWAIARWCTFLSPRVICWVLRLACLKLVVALFWVEPIGLPLLPATPAGIVTRETLVTRATSAQVGPEEPPLIERFRLVGQIDPQMRPVSNRIGLPALLQSLWLVGFCGCVMITIRRWFLIRRLCGEAQSTRSVVLQHAFRLEAQRLGIHHLPKLRLSRRADGPLLAGIGRPTIVLPNGAEESFDESELRLMLAHELAHLKRRDLLWNWLPTIVGSLFWFHPLVWLIKRRWCEAQEAACDEMLIQNHVARPAEYGRLLLKLAAGWPQQSGAALIAAGMFGSYRNLERRILTMTRVRAFSSRRLIITALVLSMVAVPGIVPWRLVAQEAGRAAERAAKTSSSAIPAQRTGNVQPGDRLAQAQSFTGSISTDGTSSNSSSSVAEQLPGKIYTWASLNLKTPTGAAEIFGGPIAIDPNTGKWEKLGIDGAAIRVSPLGDMLSFSRQGPPDPQTGFTNSEVFFSNLRGGQPVRVAENGSSTVWSPDGKRLLYHVNDRKKSADVGFRGAVWIFDLATKQTTKAPLPETDDVSDWSLTGDWLVTVSDRDPPFGHGYQLYVMHPDGTDQRRLTQGDGLNCYPRFQPATNRIAYHHQGHGFDSLWLVDFDGANRKQILSSDLEGHGAPNGAAWSPDGKWLAVARFDWESRFIGWGKTKKRELFRGTGSSKDRLEIIAPDGSSRGPLKLDHVVDARFFAQPDWR
jgi:beta-lactamase regulating signal transducer with metallopeptidase domain